MSVVTYAQRVVIANCKTFLYAVLFLLNLAWNYVKNPFRDPLALKLRLEPPTCLTDPKYGVHKYIKVNNTKLHYVDSGDSSKPLMIFIHGFPEFWFSWRYQIVEFNKDYWCVAVDTRGYGDSERPEGVSAYTLDVLVEDIRDLVRQLGREKCILVAHDWGGLIGVAFRDKYPEVLDALVILASSSIHTFNHLMWTDAEQSKMSWYVFFHRCPMLPENMYILNDMEVFDHDNVFFGKDTITKMDMECYKYWFGKPESVTPPLNYYRANFSYTLPEKAKDDKNVPFLQVMAGNDLYLSAEKHIAGLKNEYENIEQTILNGAGHFMQQEQPIKVNELIRGFLKKHNL